MTRPRIAVLQAVHANPHSDTETIFEAVRDALPDVCLQTVYDVLHALTDVGLLRRVQLPGSRTRYESRVGDNHHHSVCRSCGSIADVDCVGGHAPCLTATYDNDFHLFHLEEAEVIYWGLCPDCFPSAAAFTGGATVGGGLGGLGGGYGGGYGGGGGYSAAGSPRLPSPSSTAAVARAQWMVGQPNAAGTGERSGYVSGVFSAMSDGQSPPTR